MTPKVQKAIIAVLTLMIIFAVSFYYLESARIKISVVNRGEKNGLSEVQTIVAGEKQVIHDLGLNGQTTFRFHTAKDWHSEKNASDVSIIYSAKDSNHTVAVPFPAIEENKNYHFLVFISENQRFEVSEVEE